MKNYQDDRYEPRNFFFKKSKKGKNLIVISSCVVCKASTCQLMISTFKTNCQHPPRTLVTKGITPPNLTHKQKQGKLDYTAQKKAKVNGCIHYKGQTKEHWRNRHITPSPSDPKKSSQSSPPSARSRFPTRVRTGGHSTRASRRVEHLAPDTARRR